MAGTIFVTVLLGIAVLVTFALGIWSIGLGVVAGIGERSGKFIALGLVLWLVLWGLSAWALFEFISHLVALFS